MKHFKIAVESAQQGTPFTVHITTGSGKMLDVNSINTSTTNNIFCQKMQLTDAICRQCYAQRNEKIRPTLVNALERNNTLFQRELTARELPIINQQIFRFHSYGELHNDLHLKNYFAIASHNPQTTFTLWTKRKDIVQRVLRTMDKPDNMIIIFSSSAIGKISKLPKGFDKVFTAHKRKQATTDNVAVNCHGSCNLCRLCYSKNDAVFINEIAK